MSVRQTFFLRAFTEPIMPLYEYIMDHCMWDLQLCKSILSGVLISVNEGFFCAKRWTFYPDSLFGRPCHVTHPFWATSICIPVMHNTNGSGYPLIKSMIFISPENYSCVTMDAWKMTNLGHSMYSGIFSCGKWLDYTAGIVMAMIPEGFYTWVMDVFSDGHHYLVPLSINYPLMSPIIHWLSIIH